MSARTLHPIDTLQVCFELAGSKFPFRVKNIPFKSDYTIFGRKMDDAGNYRWQASPDSTGENMFKGTGIAWRLLDTPMPDGYTECRCSVDVLVSTGRHAGLTCVAGGVGERKK